MIMLFMGYLTKIKDIVAGYTLLLAGLILGTVPYYAIRRGEICRQCMDRRGSWCRLCLCYIPAKVRAAKAKCPKGLWGRRGAKAGVS